GNGRVFALAGLTEPQHTLHALAGPTYEADGGYFGDWWFELADARGPLAWTTEAMQQSLSAPVTRWQACVSAGCLEGVDFAPPGAPCLLRRVRWQGAAAVEARVRAHNAVVAEARALVERLEDRPAKALFVRVLDADAEVDGEALRLALPAGEAEFTVQLCAVDGTPEPPPIDAEAALNALVARYATWRAPTIAAQLPDGRVVDFLEGQLRTFFVQTSLGGGVSPMHRYTRVWMRDCIGPMLALLDMGAHEAAAALLDYVDAGLRFAGDFRNSFAADLDPAAAPPPPDWHALPPLAGRTAAETPSYYIWMHWLYWQHTGDLSRARAALPALRRALFGQAFGPDDHLPFTGDETFRLAMNMAFDLAAEHPHETASWSANSTFLWLGAARRLTALADAIGDTALAEAVRARFAQVDAAARATWLDEDGCFIALIDRASGARSPPFEDVSLKALWAGWLDADDALARPSIDCLVDRLGLRPGVLQSPLASRYSGVPVLAGEPGVGVFTGMLPGYTLSALAAVEHPHLWHAFAALGAALDPSGNAQEYEVMGRDGPYGLTLSYDPSGRGDELTPKLRPWEGGIAAHAVFDALLGFAPDAPAGVLRLRPRLPPGWSAMRWTGLRVGDRRLEVRVDAAGVEVTSLAGPGLRVEVAGVAHDLPPGGHAGWPWPAR
ncbi:MAG: hypothetical protein KC620_10660, partial [Myxococcales bacterium]|nr:hypothetical protein [Myxococcales bacterium]